MAIIEYKFWVDEGTKYIDIDNDDYIEYGHYEIYEYEVPTREVFKLVTEKYAKDKGINIEEAGDIICDMSDEEYDDEFKDFLEDYYYDEAKRKWSRG